MFFQLYQIVIFLQNTLQMRLILLQVRLFDNTVYHEPLVKSRR